MNDNNNSTRDMLLKFCNTARDKGIRLACEDIEILQSILGNILLNVNGGMQENPITEGEWKKVPHMGIDEYAMLKSAKKVSLLQAIGLLIGLMKKNDLARPNLRIFFLNEKDLAGKNLKLICHSPCNDSYMYLYIENVKEYTTWKLSYCYFYSTQKPA